MQILERASRANKFSLNRSEIAVQLALSYEIGFGMERDTRKSQDWLRISGMSATSLSAKLYTLRSSEPVVKYIDQLMEDSQGFGLTYRYDATGVLDQAIKHHRFESQGIVASLGPNTQVSLRLHMMYALCLETAQRLDDALTLYQRILISSGLVYGCK